MKVDRYTKHLSKRIDNFSNGNGNYNDDDGYGLTKHDDEYYLDRGEEPPEERYQREKAHWYWHDSSWIWRGPDTTRYDGQGCNQFTGCIPECRFYPECGRIEDEQVIEEHNKLVESHRQENSTVDPPSESELLKLAKIHSFD